MKDQPVESTQTAEAKREFNARAKAAMRDHLRAKSWVEKVEAIARMNVASRLAKQAMRKATEERVPSSVE